MADNELLRAEELEFLLQQAEAQSQGGEFGNLSQAENARVTVRGDLDKINLADIFQTLGTSKIEGILRVRTALETREIFFHDGQIRYRFPARAEGKRLGQRLIRSKLITSDQLRMALLVQKKVRKPLGSILIEHDYVTQEDLDRVADQQLQEDLFDLFTWNRGFFEFQKGAAEDPIFIERFEQAPEFDVGNVLLEVASRAEEWQVILDSLHSVDEIPVSNRTVDTSDIDEVEMAMLRAVDGEQSVRELAETTGLGLFSCAKVAVDLLKADHIQLADTQTLLKIAQDALVAGHVKRALLTMHTLQEREQNLSTGMVMVMADVLQDCGDPRMAARTLLAATEKISEPEGRIQIAQRARELDHRSIEILNLLHREYVKAELTETQEFLEVSNHLSDALSERGAHDEALQVIAPLESGSLCSSDVLSRKARILQRASRNDEAVNVLLKLAETWENLDNREQLITTYEHILKIDPSQKEVARSLKELKTNKTMKYARWGAILAVLAGVAVSGSIYVDNLNTEWRIEIIQQSVGDRLMVNDVMGAQ